MRGTARVLTLLLLVITMALSGCRKGPSASYDSSKKLKRGKPIPCPIKDC